MVAGEWLDDSGTEKKKNKVRMLHTLLFTGDHIKYDLGYLYTKTIYFAIFTNNIWSYLLWSPVILYYYGGP